MKKKSETLASISHAYHDADIHPDRFYILDIILRNLSSGQYRQFVQVINRKKKQETAHIKNFSPHWQQGEYGSKVISDADITRGWSLASLFCAYMIADR